MDRNLRMIRTAFDVRVSARDGVIHVSGDAEPVQRAADVLRTLQDALLDRTDLPDDFIRSTVNDALVRPAKGGAGDIDVYLRSASIAPRGEGQSRYVEAVSKNDITLCAGPAGTGKTYLAVAIAVSLLKQNRIKRIILVRPAVEAGEKLGFLPGDMQAKVNPYLRPLFDAMHDMMSFEQIRRFMENDIVEIVPLAFMRGRTLNNAVVILDEAQNATARQMLMFLTRLGHNSKMIVTGDDSQSDLADGASTGFIDAVRRLESVEGIAVVRLGSEDIVRHPLVQKVVAAYGPEAGRVQ